MRNLHEACKHSDDLDRIAYFLGAGADINGTDELQMTPLHCAAYNGRLEVVRLLLARGADPNRRNMFGRTPAQEATEQKHVEVARLINEHQGAGPTPVDNESLREAIKTIEEAEEYLFQNLDREYEPKLAQSLEAVPEAAIEAMNKKGWSRDGTAADANRFLLGVLAGIYKAGGPCADKALDTMISIFRTPDRNTSAWAELTEGAANTLGELCPAGARARLEAVKKTVKGRNLQAVEFALKQLNLREPRKWWQFWK